MSMEQVWETRAQIPTFYGGGGKGTPSKTVEIKERWPDLIGLAVSMLFGAIHCVAWSFVFSSVNQRKLWRVCAVAIVISPGTMLLSLMFWLFFNYVDGCRSTRYPIKYVRWPVEGVAMFVAAFSFLFYVTARLILFVLAFATLSSLPPDAYRTVRWTLHIPHIM